MLDEAAAEKDLRNWRKFRGRMGEDARGTPVYRMRLNGPAPAALTLHPQNLRVGDAVIGQALLDGTWKIGRDSIKCPVSSAPWDQAGPSRHFADRLHRFAWLKHLTSTGQDGQRLARDLVARWVQEFGKWNSFVWRLPVTVDRVWNWLAHGPILFDNLAPDSDVLNSLVRQGRHLQLSTDDCPEPRMRLRSVLTQIVLAFALDEAIKKLPDLETQLVAMLTEQILPDGGHVSRNPEALLELLLDLQTVDDLYLRTGRPSLPVISRLVPRMAGMLKLLRTDDGGLPIMNGGSEGNRTDLKNALFPYSGTRAFAFASKSGVQKLEAGTTRLLLDSGHAPPPEHGIEAHAGCLAFEMEDNGERVITNCGSHVDVDPVWRAATRRTSGHSTLAMAGTDASDFEHSRSAGIDIPVGPFGVSARRMEERDEVLIDAQHSGWKDAFGLVYRRRLFMNDAGTRLTGEDSLFRPLSAGIGEDNSTIAYDVRFHLHPSVRLQPDGPYLQIVLPSGAKWHFKTSHKQKSIERSVYLGRGTVEKCWQLVLSGDAEPNGDANSNMNLIKWAFIKIA